MTAPLIATTRDIPSTAAHETIEVSTATSAKTKRDLRIQLLHDFYRYIDYRQIKSDIEYWEIVKGLNISIQIGDRALCQSSEVQENVSKRDAEISKVYDRIIALKKRKDEIYSNEQSYQSAEKYFSSLQFRKDIDTLFEALFDIDLNQLPVVTGEKKRVPILFGDEPLLIFHDTGWNQKYLVFQGFTSAVNGTPQTEISLGFEIGSSFTRVASVFRCGHICLGTCKSFFTSTSTSYEPNANFFYGLLNETRLRNQNREEIIAVIMSTTELAFELQHIIRPFLTLDPLTTTTMLVRGNNDPNTNGDWHFEDDFSKASVKGFGYLNFPEYR